MIPREGERVIAAAVVSRQSVVLDWSPNGVEVMGFDVLLSSHSQEVQDAILQSQLVSPGFIRTLSRRCYAFRNGR